ncbi:MAG TPA: hypothetical protein VGE68_02450 [Sphingomicrobium sp.]
MVPTRFYTPSMEEGEPEVRRPIHRPAPGEIAQYHEELAAAQRRLRELKRQPVYPY